MRVTPRLRRDERGAVLVIVALSLVVLLGMLALVVDLGRAVAVRRAMVNASDSAALAAAQKCALGFGSGQAQAAATATAKMNDANATLVSFDAGPECDSLQTLGLKLVTVRYTTTVDYFVAPILGIDSQDVTTQATAQWGPAQKASPIPLRLDLDALLPCVGDFNSTVEKTCYLGFDNNDPFGAENDWGWLYFGGQDGAGWNTTDCTSQAGGSGDPIWFIEGNGFDAGVLKTPPPTYVCSFSANAQDVVGALAGREGDILTFPVVDAVNYPVIGKGANLAWPVIAFTKLRLITVYDQPGASLHCPSLLDIKNQSQFCLELRWEGPQPGGSDPGEGPVYGMPAVRLVK